MMALGRTRERVITFGPGAGLTAIGCAADRERATASTVILLNAGVIHRIGPHRLHVDLARALAADGVPSARVDLAGIGDSGGVPGDLTFRQSAVANTRALMDTLGGERFVLFGLCSGADNALATAAEDARVTGLALIDPPAYVTRASRQRLLRRRVQATTTLDDARTLMTQASRKLWRRLRPAPGSATVDSGGRQAPPLEDYLAVHEALLARGVRILNVFSGALGPRYNHREQIFEWAPRLRGRITLAYFPEANHVFTELRGRAALMATVRTWLDDVHG